MFRFENFDIWNRSIEVINKIFDLSDLSEDKHLYKLSEQLHGAVVSITNNIAEGSVVTRRENLNFPSITHIVLFLKLQI